MMRRKIPLPSTNGAAAGGYGHAGYGTPVGGGAGNGAGGYSSQGGGYGGGGGAPGGAGAGGYAYGSSGGGGGGGSHYSGYGSSTGGGGGFGVGMGEAYGESSYGGAADSRSSLKGKKKRPGSSSPVSLALLMDKFVIALIVALLSLGMTMYYRSQYKLVLNKFHVQSISEAVKSYERLEQEKKRFQREAISGKETDRNLKNTIRELEKTNRELRKQQDELKVRYEASGGMGVEESEKLKAREGAWKKQVQLLQNATQRESKRAVMERFGPGPHHVLFTVSIPTDEGHSDTGTFQVELAPLNEMPHANHLFLQQVYHELWDGTWFYLNGPHVLQAGPQDWEEETAGQSLKRFTETQLDKLSFPEYSHSFPHVPWTLGFTGRPGGPDFYINKADNTKPHGPGGQYQHSLEEQADSCFAKIVDGKDTLQRIFHMEIYPRGSEYAYFLEEPVEIVSARILEPIKDNVQKAKHALHHDASAKKIKKPQRVDVNQEAIDAVKAEQISEIIGNIHRSLQDAKEGP